MGFLAARTKGLLPDALAASLCGSKPSSSLGCFVPFDSELPPSRGRVNGNAASSFGQPGKARA